MELRDLVVTPVVIMLVYVAAYMIRPWVTDAITYKYFFPALTVRIFGALAVGFIYQFYYDGGDTYNYHTHGSRHLWDAFLESPENFFRVIFNNGSDTRDIYKYTSRVIFFTDPSSYAVVKTAFVFDIFTFSTYSATAVLFAVLSFIGVWMFFLAFYEQYPHLHRGIAIATLFIPSVFFWGSGLLKDTLSLSCVSIAVYQTYRIFIARRFSVQHLLLLLFAFYGLYAIKIYILLTFLPAAILWIFFYNFGRIRSAVLKVMLLPFMLAVVGGLAFYSIMKAGEDNPKYSITKLAETAKVTAYDIRYWTGRDAGSGYSLGELDGSFSSMLRLAPQAVNVSLFRPYLWEVKNPLMLLSAMESLVFLVIAIYLVVRMNKYLLGALSQANILFLLIFSVTFAFAVGVSTFNFGTLVRYKIPMLPFLAIAFLLISDYANRRRKLEALEETEY